MIFNPESLSQGGKGGEVAIIELTKAAIQNGSTHVQSLCVGKSSNMASYIRIVILKNHQLCNVAPGLSEGQ